VTGGNEKTKPNKANPPPAGSMQETLAPATFGIWIAGKLEFFDGFDILPVTVGAGPRACPAPPRGVAPTVA